MIALAALALAAAAPQPGEIVTFSDWTVGCDNGRACQAVALLPPDTYEAATMAVERGAGAAARPELRIALWEGEPAAIAVDGRRFAIAPVAGQDGILAPADPDGLLAAIVAGRRAVLVDEAGRALAPLSTAGASAALRWMDDRQGRAGTVTAVVARGAAPASAVPAPPPLPVIDAAPGSDAPPRMLGADAVAAARADSACETPEEEGEPEAHRLDAAHSLVLVPLRCGSGAYNFLSVAFVVDEAGRAGPARFDDSAPEDGEGEEHWVYNAGWDGERLGTYFKGRGIGDCGVTRQYAWDGSRFRLADQAEMGECRGSTDYITTWRAEVR